MATSVQAPGVQTIRQLEAGDRLQHWNYTPVKRIRLQEANEVEAVDSENGKTMP